MQPTGNLFLRILKEMKKERELQKPLESKNINSIETDNLDKYLELNSSEKENKQ